MKPQAQAASMRALLIAMVMLPTAWPASGFDVWSADMRSGCRVLVPFLQPKETIIWGGECKNYVADGRGVLQVFEDGQLHARVYGEFHNGKLNGYGVITLADGSSFDGEWRESLPNGHGVWSGSPKDRRRYEGEWRDGVKNGHGIETSPGCFTVKYCGLRYEGEFLNDLWSGRGLLTLDNGGRYEGDFRKNQFDGHGLRTWPDGSRYEGEFSDGLANGIGTLTQRGETYSGVWKDGCFHDGNRRAAIDGRDCFKPASAVAVPR